MELKKVGLMDVSDAAKYLGGEEVDSLSIQYAWADSKSKARLLAPLQVPVPRYFYSGSFARV